MSDVHTDNVEVTDVNDEAEDTESEDMPGGLDSCALDFAQAILTGSWANGSLEDRQNFREEFYNYVTAANTLRGKWDAQVWARHAQGLDTPKDLPSIRQPRTGDKPGRKAKAKTLADQLLKK